MFTLLWSKSVLRARGKGCKWRRVLLAVYLLECQQKLCISLKTWYCTRSEVQFSCYIVVMPWGTLDQSSSVCVMRMYVSLRTYYSDFLFSVEPLQCCNMQKKQIDPLLAALASICLIGCPQHGRCWLHFSVSYFSVIVTVRRRQKT